MAHTAQDRSPDSLADRSVPELVRLATEQITTLAQDEIRLARSELTAKGKRAGMGAGLFGTAGIAAFYGGGLLIATIVTALAIALPAWLASLIMAVILFASAGVFALIGWAQVRRARPPVPESTVSSVRSDVQTVAEAVKDRGRQ